MSLNLIFYLFNEMQFMYVYAHSHDFLNLGKSWTLSKNAAGLILGLQFQSNWNLFLYLGSICNNFGTQLQFLLTI